MRIPATSFALLAGFAMLAGCGGPDHPPPPAMWIEGGLPVSGSLHDAHKAGFTNCFSFTVEMRCRRNGVMFHGFGPYNAAVDLNGGNGGGGFDQLTLWHDGDQYALLAVVNALERQGWRACFTGDENRGDQGIYTHPKASVRLSLDLSYWGKRRLRVIPNWNRRERSC